MTKNPKTCLFCREADLTNEHIVPEWLKQLIPKKKRDGNLFMFTHHASRYQTRRLRQGSPISRQVRYVCRSCNNNWLSQLEDELKPTIIDLVVGKPTTLTHWKQRRLATWAVKTAMVAEHLHPSSAAISFELREQLRLHREPPKTFSVWVGFYADMGLLLGIEHHSGAFYYSEPGAEPSMALNTQATAIGLGRLFFQVAQSDAPGVGFQLKDEGVSKLRRIWPPVGTGDIPWPPPLALDATDIATILRGIHNAFEDRLI